jgi:D-alanyl-D-alanine dipeptidase
MKNKIMPSGVQPAFFMIFLTITAFTARSQVLPRSSYGLPIVNSISLFEQTLRQHPEKEMIAVPSRSGLLLDLRYATKNNFVNKILYTEKPRETYLRKPVATALDGVLADLKKMGLGLKIFDAYRPYFITSQLWKKEPDSRYAADPAKGSGHNRGIAVDLSLIDLRTQQPLEMPTGFDNFSDSAHQDFIALEARVIQHRNLLKQVMEKHGFIALATEWWHFSWPHPENYEVLDLSFHQMKEIVRNRQNEK